MTVRKLSFQATLVTLIWSAALIPALFLSMSQIQQEQQSTLAKIQQDLTYNARNLALESRQLLQSAINGIDQLATNGNIIKSATFEYLSIRSIDQMRDYHQQFPVFHTIMMLDTDFFQTEIHPTEALKYNITSLKPMLTHIFQSDSTFINPDPQFTVLPSVDMIPNARPGEHTLVMIRPILKPRDSVSNPFEVISAFLLLADVDLLIQQTLNSVNVDLATIHLTVTYQDKTIFDNLPSTPMDNRVTFRESLNFGSEHSRFEITVSLPNRLSVTWYDALSNNREPLLWLGAVLLAMFTFASFLTRQLVKPVSQLRDISRTLAEHDFSVSSDMFEKVDHKFKEFSEVHTLLETMSKTISEQFDRLRQSNEEIEKTALHLESSVAEREEQNEILNSLTQYALVIQHEMGIEQIGNLTLELFLRIASSSTGLVIYRNQYLKGFTGLEYAPIGFLKRMNSFNSAYLTEEYIEQLNDIQQDYFTLPIYVKDEFSGFVVIQNDTKNNFQRHAINMFVTVLQVTLEQHMLRLELEKLANSDALTGLYNRHYFDASLVKLQEHHRKENDFNFGLIIIDVNGLKQVNDKIGHAAGDLLIQTVSKLLTETTRLSDITARTGGDEFVILLEQTDTAFCQVLTDRLNEQSGQKTLTIQGQTIQVSFSLGFACTDNDDVNRLFELADDRMYRAKQAHYTKKLTT